VGHAAIGPWLGSFRWKHVSSTVAVPAQAQVALLSIGLNGGTGSLSVDDVKLASYQR
jgi:hypothetical protein